MTKQDWEDKLPKEVSVKDGSVCGEKACAYQGMFFFFFFNKKMRGEVHFSSIFYLCSRMRDITVCSDKQNKPENTASFTCKVNLKAQTHL